MLPIFFAAFILATCCLTKGDCISHDEMKELKTEFAINLYQHMAEGENRTSLVVSPASVVVSLELLQFGAQGNTFKELRDALGYSIHDQSVQGFLHMMYEGATGSSSQGTVVRQACSLFVQAGVQLWPRFVARTACWANSSLQQANFRDPNTTAAQIQEWITSNTGGPERGPDLMSLETAPSPLNQVAVVSTMYFKSTWQKKFSFMDTQILPFTTAEGSTLKVPTMHKTAEVNYGNYPCSRSGILYNMQELYNSILPFLNFFSFSLKCVSSLQLERLLRTVERRGFSFNLLIVRFDRANSVFVIRNARNISDKSV
uniref:Serpin family E member 3 n=1 Tax=Apteryx owenii TaxID=8824 RepID=A0A8B9PHJ6_APTOW